MPHVPSMPGLRIALSEVHAASRGASGFLALDVSSSSPHGHRKEFRSIASEGRAWQRSFSCCVGTHTIGTYRQLCEKSTLSRKHWEVRKLERGFRLHKVRSSLGLGRLLS